MIFVEKNPAHNFILQALEGGVDSFFSGAAKYNEASTGAETRISHQLSTEANEVSCIRLSPRTAAHWPWNRYIQPLRKCKVWAFGVIGTVDPAAGDPIISRSSHVNVDTESYIYMYIYILYI